MPFTFSHPAIVLPLTKLSRNWLSLSGLVAGSISPDFEYFIRLRMYSGISHEAEGILLFDLPVGIALTFIFHNFIRNSLFDNSPEIIRSRVEVFESFNWNRYFASHWVAVMVSVLIGSMSHLFWDSFTHNYTFFVERYEVLRQEVFIFGIRTYRHRIIQHVSTLLGGAVIAYAVWKLPTHLLRPSVGSKAYWPVVISLTIVISAIRITAAETPRHPALFVVTFIAAGIIAIIAAPILLRLKRSDHDIR